MTGKFQTLSPAAAVPLSVFNQTNVEAERNYSTRGKLLVYINSVWMGECGGLQGAEEL